MKPLYQNISEMNISYGNPLGCALEADGSISDKGMVKLLNQVKNLYDERKELLEDGFLVLSEDPTSKSGRKEVFDAIADLLVFLHGVGHFINSEVKYNPEEKIMVLPEFYNDIEDNIVKLRPDMIDFYGSFIFILGYHIDFLVSAIKQKNLEDVKHFYKLINNDLTFLFDQYKKEGYTQDLLIHRVTVSNMSKLCKNEVEAKLTLKHYEDLGVNVHLKDSPLLQDSGVPFLVVYSPIDQVVNGKEYRQGKALKNINWSEPELYDF